MQLLTGTSPVQAQIWFSGEVSWWVVKKLAAEGGELDWSFAEAPSQTVGAKCLTA